MFGQCFIMEKDTGKLLSPFVYYDWSKPVVTAQPLSVTFVTSVVAEDLDGLFRGDNDILIMTRSSMGQQPLVKRVHYFESEIPKGMPIQNLYANSVFVTDDYNGIDRLWIELNILEVDTDTGERKETVAAFESLASNAGAVFPVIIPYVAATSNVLKVVNKIFSAFEKDTKVIKFPVSFYPGKQRPGYTPLQEGTFVVFPRPIDPEGLILGADGRLSGRNDIGKISYAVFDLYMDKRVSPEYIENQKIATLLTQLYSGNKNTTRSSMEFLEETIKGYSSFKKLMRYLELAKKDKLTPQEKALMDRLGHLEELKPFIPRENS